MFYLLILLNFLRFIGLSFSPPGFYMDEAAGATQVICLSESGFDYYGVHYPLFAAGFPGFGLYTPTFLYGELAWTTIFGHSIEAFRSFSAFITSSTVFFLYFYIKNIGSQRAAIYVAFAASIMPWAFQFSRIAWDPPVAVLFLVAALWASSLKRGSWLAGVFLALAAYSYPPMRITALVLWIFLPGVKLKNKLICLVIALLVCIPLWIEIRDPEFMGRARSLAIWGTFYENPYQRLGIFGLPVLYLKQLLAHFSPYFLFMDGDKNLRHSIQSFGMLSWLDLFAILSGFIVSILAIFKKISLKLIFPNSNIYYISALGILIGITPAALTNEGLPHALRSLAAWPFFACLTGAILCDLEKLLKPQLMIKVTLSIGLIFFGCYQYSYFTNYPVIAQNSFWVGYSPLAKGYYQLTEDGVSCSSISQYTKPFDINETIFFSNKVGIHGNGRKYLRNHWAEQEEWGIWTYGKGADLVLDLPIEKPSAIIFQVRALIGPAMPSQRVSIWVDGKFLKDAVLTKMHNNEIDVSLKDLSEKQKKVWIEFRIFRPTSPIDAGISMTDSRPLGIALESAIFK